MLAPACNRKKQSTLHVCIPCNATMVGFRNALLAGDVTAATQHARTGRIRYVSFPMSMFKEEHYPIHSACAGGSVVLVRWLVEYMGARVDVVDKFGNLPITVAAKSGALEVCRYLVQSSRMTLHSVADVTLLQDLLQTVLSVCPVQLPAKAQLRPPKKR